MRTQTLTAALNGIVSVVLASAAATAACDGKLSDADPTTDTGDSGTDAADRADSGTDRADSGADDSTLTCTAPLAEYTSNLQPALPIDHVELRTQQAVPYGSDAGSPASTLISESGTACASAADTAACQTALEQARIGTGTGWPGRWYDGWGASPPTNFLVFTRGEHVGVVDSPETLVAFLGTIDTLEEARLVLSSKTFPLECKTEPFKTGWKRTADGGWEFTTNASDCGNVTRLRAKISADGVYSVIARDELTTGSVCGRRPDGLVAMNAPGAEHSVAAWLAEAAHLEAASVMAFRVLEVELRRLGAPRDLLVRARRSRADEIRHARVMARLARRFGAEPARVVMHPPTERTEFAIALENAVEGCVRETYGALVAAYQARTASDPELRSVLEGIARDEARHASLAHDVARWLEPRLEATERAAIAKARDEAVVELRDALRRRAEADVIRLAGMPTPRDALALLALLEQQVLGEAA